MLEDSAFSKSDFPFPPMPFTNTDRPVAPPVAKEHVSADGTVKWLFDVGRSNAIETVFIPEDDRGTLCVSSQAGCAVGCRFCSTGHQGFSRHLTAGEIVGQLWWAEHALRKRLGSQERVITNVVFMGMGEPMHNYPALVPALRTMLDDHAYGLSRRRVTVSTSGVVPMIDRLAADCPVALAISLHASSDALRDTPSSVSSSRRSVRLRTRTTPAHTMPRTASMMPAAMTGTPIVIAWKRSRPRRGGRTG